MTVSALLTQEELVEVAKRGRCVCGHLRVFHIEGFECEKCDCLDFRPEPFPKTYPDGARVRVRPRDPSVWGDKEDRSFVGRLATVTRTGPSDDSLKYLRGKVFILFDGELEGFWISPQDLEAAPV